MAVFVSFHACWSCLSRGSILCVIVYFALCVLTFFITFLSWDINIYYCVIFFLPLNNPKMIAIFIGEYSFTHPVVLINFLVPFSIYYYLNVCITLWYPFKYTHLLLNPKKATYCSLFCLDELIFKGTLLLFFNWLCCLFSSFIGHNRTFF